MHQRRPLLFPFLISYLSPLLAWMNSISFFLCLQELLRGQPTGIPRLEWIESYYSCWCRAFTLEMLTYRVSTSVVAIRNATKTNANTTKTANVVDIGAAYWWSFTYFSRVNNAAFSFTKTAGPWDGPAYWLNALVFSLTCPIKRRIGIAAHVLL